MYSHRALVSGTSVHALDRCCFSFIDTNCYHASSRQDIGGQGWQTNSTHAYARICTHARMHIHARTHVHTQVDRRTGRQADRNTYNHRVVEITATQPIRGVLTLGRFRTWTVSYNGGLVNSARSYNCRFI